ncbi:Rqc2 family fibronectin-binding protein [Alicyclobacillus sp. ALC3]|uniref:Rqc2 family fibronectin-binding protein n=1 Tax=Alicyclobacillus sp. ALC3 TaxID=2796143 RepID=UPI002379DD2B|nr:NFACT RNA binding domain-containing protein [Alicyclobacillus sp. ALC3]WDL97422.1 NFACT family protein [Alicyclobacillus sp. ALC3]
MDGFAIAALAKEWQRRLVPARIEKIHQPSARDIVLTVRTRGESERLLLSAHRQAPRAHALYGTRPGNPEEPPMFCMLLRKRLESGRLVGVRQQGTDRVLELSVEAVNELGDLVRYVLVLEVMGKHSNLMLCTSDENGRPDQVVDSIVRVSSQMSRVRPIFPGVDYEQAPPQQRTPAAAIDEVAIAKLNLAALGAKEQVRTLCGLVAGMGPTTAREALYRAGPDLVASRVAAAVLQLDCAVRTDTEPASVGLDELGRAVAAAPFALTSYAGMLEMPSFDGALDALYKEMMLQQRLSNLAADLSARVAEQIDRVRGKLEKVTQMLRDNQDYESPRMAADLLTAYAHAVDKGQSEVTLPNFYDEERPLTIILDPGQSAIENAQRYYRHSSKKKRSLPILESQRAQAKQDLDYLEGVRSQLQDASPAELEEIREELVKEGFVSAPRRRNGRGKAAKTDRRSEAPALVSSDGMTIRVGRNNAQNDRLTFRRSQSEDIWLHVKDAPGSHVVISTNGQPVPDSTLHEAALLAAYFSKARDSANVPVDCTQVKHVWKPSGGRPGLALYDHYKTLFVSPDRSQLGVLLQKLERRQGPTVK